MRTIHPDPISIIQPGAMSYFKLAGFITGLVYLFFIGKIDNIIGY